MSVSLNQQQLVTRSKASLEPKRAKSFEAATFQNLNTTQVHIVHTVIT